MVGQGGQPRRAVTRDDVARYAGVSTAVVSYVLNGGPKSVSGPTRDRVLDAVRVLGYRPNTTARALSRGRVDMLGMIVSDSRNPYFAELVYAVEVAAQKAGRSLLVFNTHARRAADQDPVAALAAQRVDGMVVSAILTAAEEHALASLDVPTVLIDQFRGAAEVSSIGTDYYAGAKAAVEHLVGHGHTQVAFVGGDLDADRRGQGWVDALSEAGLPLGPRYRVGFGLENGYDAGLRLAAESPRPTAVFAASDQLAIGVTNGLHSCGVRVPEDVAIVGFDGTNEARYAWPALTTVAQPMTIVAEEAVRLLVAGSREPVFRTYAPTLVVRRSCGCHGDGSAV